MILGVDIDGALIVKGRNILNMRANEHSESETLVWAVEREVEKKTRSKSGSNDSDVSSSSHCTDSLLSFRNYHFKECSIYSDGFSSQPISDTLFRTFPYTVYFKQENFLENTHFGGPYDTITWWASSCGVTCSFSVTKWVHLNWGDDGLLLLLVKSCVLLKQGGLLIIEYQPWASYEKRQNYTELFARNYPCLRLRPEKIPVILQQLGMQLIRKQKPPQQKGPPGFNRNITVFKKTSFELKLDVQTLTLSSLRQVLDVESLIERVETDELLVSWINNRINNNTSSSAPAYSHSVVW